MQLAGSPAAANDRLAEAALCLESCASIWTRVYHPSPTTTKYAGIASGETGLSAHWHKAGAYQYATNARLRFKVGWARLATAWLAP
jgi:hypothetical protein